MECKACGYIKNKWDNIDMKWIKIGILEWISLPIKDLYACPKCFTVIYFNDY